REPDAAMGSRTGRAASLRRNRKCRRRVSLAAANIATDVLPQEGLDFHSPPPQPLVRQGTPQERAAGYAQKNLKIDRTSRGPVRIIRVESGGPDGSESPRNDQTRWLSPAYQEDRSDHETRSPPPVATAGRRLQDVANKVSGRHVLIEVRKRQTARGEGPDRFGWADRLKGRKDLAYPRKRGYLTIRSIVK